MLPLLAFVAALYALPSTAQTPVPPWELDAVTTNDLNGKAFEAALPIDFSRYVLNLDDIPGFTHPALAPWSQETTNYAYYDPTRPGTAPGVIATSTRLAAGWGMADAIEAVSEAEDNRSVRYVVEQDGLSDGGPIAFLLAYGTDPTGLERHSVVWGTHAGVWLFEIRALSSADREVFVHSLVRELLVAERDSTAPGTPTVLIGRAPAAEPTRIAPTATRIPTVPLVPTLTPTGTSRPSATSIPTRVPRPRPTSTPQPTATPNEQADIAWSEREAIACVEREDFDCPVEVFTAALDRHPDSIRLRENLFAALMVQGLGREEEGDIAGARAAYERAFDLSPANPQASRAIDALRPYERIIRGDGMRGVVDQRFTTGTNDYGDVYYADYALQIRAKNGQGIYFTFPETRSIARTSIAVQAAWIEGDGFVQVSYSDPQNPDDVYMLQLRPLTGEWRFTTFDYVDRVWIDLIPWTYFDGLAPEGLWTLELRLVDGVFYMLINRQSVGSIASSTFQTGDAHFGAGLFPDSTTPTFTAAFNNLRIFEIN